MLNSQYGYQGKVKDNTCFFIMPFSKEYQNVYSILKRTLESEKFECIRSDKITTGSVEVMPLVLKNIKEAQYIITDISKATPNVFYELGLAHSIKDKENVFIIKEKSVEAPFDISHLKYIEYDKDDLENLGQQIMTHLKANEHINVFKSLLRESVFFNDNDVLLFVDYIKFILNKKDIEIINSLLKNDIRSDEKDILEFIFRLDKSFQEIIGQNQNITQTSLFRLYSVILTKCSDIEKIQQHIKDFLETKQYGNLRETALLSYQTDLAIALASQSKMIEVAMQWIIAYFSRSKSTTVDLNRYKLEAFLIQSDLNFVNEYIVNALVSENHHVREHMADIVGEKKIQFAKDNLLLQLKREENIFTASSLIEAIGKLKIEQGVFIIINWLDHNIPEPFDSTYLFLLRHSKNAITNINNGKEIPEAFNKRYQPILDRFA